MIQNSLQVFDFESQAVRTTEIEGAPWFVATDVCSALGYQNPSKAVTDHVDEEDRSSITIRYGTDGNPNRIVVNESGLYALIFGSRLESAKRFKRWVTSEVLPAIRKTGGYRTPDLPYKELSQQQLRICAQLSKPGFPIGVGRTLYNRLVTVNKHLGLETPPMETFFSVMDSSEPFKTSEPSKVSSTPQEEALIVRFWKIYDTLAKEHGAKLNYSRHPDRLIAVSYNGMAEAAEAAEAAGITLPPRNKLMAAMRKSKSPKYLRRARLYVTPSGARAYCMVFAIHTDNVVSFPQQSH